MKVGDEPDPVWCARRSVNTKHSVGLKGHRRQREGPLAAVAQASSSVRSCDAL